jgi:choline dehydrogenase-like flavoprotein
VVARLSIVSNELVPTAFETHTDPTLQLLVNMFSMASRQDLDNWAELGNNGWGFEDLLPYYRKFETFHPTGSDFAAKVNDKYLDAALRGTSGPIHVSNHASSPSCMLT